MKTIQLLLAATTCVAALSGCEAVLDSQGEECPTDEAANSQLLIKTRADGDTSADGTTDAALQQGRIYIFNADGTCTAILSTSEEQTSASATLAAGTYSVYAVGSDDLERYELPTQQDAQPTSVIMTQTGKVIGDLLMGGATSITLQDGETRQLNLRLDRKVFCLSSITINKVPDDVTQVDVSLEPLYSSIQLNGTYPDATQPCRVSLSRDDETAGRWAATPMLMQYPSKNLPTITVYFTRADGIKSYSYTSTEAIEANHHLSIEGTYTEPLGVTLQGILTSTEWGEDKTIVFDFDEGSATGHESGNGDDNTGGGDDASGSSQQSGDTPVVGQMYKGCLVAAVDGRQATLVSPTEKNGFPTTGGMAQQVEEALATWPNVEGVSGTWRVPTTSEATDFLLNYLITSVGTYSYCVIEDGILQRLSIAWNYAQNKPVFDKVEETFSMNMRLRPVIDITF